MPLAVTFPLSGRFRDLHPLEHVRAGQTTTKKGDHFRPPFFIYIGITAELKCQKFSILHL